MIMMILIFIAVNSFVFSQENKEYDSKKVEIYLEEGIQLENGYPGYLISIFNWGSETIIEIYVIDRAGKTLGVVTEDKNIKSHKDGSVSFSIPYIYGDLAPGICQLMVAGPVGIHMVEIEYPAVIVPTKDNPLWRLQFVNPPAKGLRKLTIEPTQE